MNCANPIKTYFLGSGRLGVPLLRALARAPEVQLVGMGTQPARPQGRHRHLAPTPIGELAADTLNLTADTPLNVNDPAFLERLRSLQPEIVVVVAYGQILRDELISLPPRGYLNAHASLLPRYRGAAPVQAAILAGDAETGISFMKIDHGVDTGPVYEQHRLALDGTETELALETRLGDLAAAHLAGCLWRVCRGGLQPIPQPATGVSVARKLKKIDGRLDWRQPATELERRVRAFSPWPGAYFELPSPKGARRILVTRGEVVAADTTPAVPGQVLRVDQQEWQVACGSGALRLARVVPEGRGEMSAAEFLRGCHVDAGTLIP